MCIESAAQSAADQGFEVTVVSDACATRAQEMEGLTISAEQVHGSAMATLGFSYAQIRTAEQVIDSLQRQPASAHSG